MDSKDEVESLISRVVDLMDDVKRLRNMLNKESSQNSQLAVIDGVNSEETRTFILNSKAQQKALEAKLAALEKKNKRLEMSLLDSKSRAEALQDKVELIESEKVALKASLNDIVAANEDIEAEADYLEEEQLRLLSKLHKKSWQVNTR